MRKLKDGEQPKPAEAKPGEEASAQAFDPKDFNLELDKVKGGYGYGGYGGGWGGYGGGGYSGGGYSGGGWGSYAGWGGGWSNW